MLGNLIKKIFGTKNERELKRIQPIVERVNSLEDRMRKLKDEELKAYTPHFKERIERGERLDEILPEAFAVVREVARRTINMRHFDVQIIGGVVLHEGRSRRWQQERERPLSQHCLFILMPLREKGSMW